MTLVVLYHAKLLGVTGGYVGVDVFFVLSGYLISSLLVDEVERTGTIRLTAFYARRARRLLPASFLVLVVVLVASLLLLAPMEATLVARTARATSLYMSNFWLWRESGDYFAANSESNPLLHTWSLAVEEQFYVFWPVIVLAGRRAASSRARLLLMMVAITVVSFAGSVWWTARDQAMAFFGTHLRAWEFGIGGLAALAPLASASWARSRGVRLFSAIAGLLLIFASGFLYRSSTPFPGLAALPPVLGTVLVLRAWDTDGHPLNLLLGNPIAQWIGTLSYSWYLWHWPVLVFGALVLSEPNAAQRLALVLLSLGLSVLAHYFIENPIRFHRALVSRSWMSLALALLLTVLGAGISTGVRGRSLALSTSGAHKPFTLAEKDTPLLLDRNCMLRFRETGVRTCDTGDTASTNRVVLFGDSHAGQWIPALEQAGLANGWRVTTVLRSACPAADVTLFSARLHRVYSECGEWRHASIEEMIAMRPAVIVMSSSTGDSVSMEDWQAGTRRTLAALSAKGIPVVVLRDTPRARDDVPSCLSRAVARVGSATASCKIDRAIGVPESFPAAERAALVGLTGVRYVDLTARFCNATSCDVLRNGLPMYSDSHHLTATFARTFADTLAVEVRHAMDSSTEGKSELAGRTVRPRE